MKNIKEQSKFIAKSIGYIIYGVCLLVVAAVAIHSVYFLLDVSKNQQAALIVAIAIAITPVAFAVGRFIWDGVTRAARETK